MRTTTVVKFFKVLICFGVLLSLAGCVKQSRSSSPTTAHGISPDDNPFVKQQIKEIDAEIAKRKKNIDEYRELKRAWTYEQIELLQRMGTSTESGRRGIAGAGPTDFAHDYDRLKNDIEAVKPAIEKEEQKIQELMQAKAQILHQQKSACFPGEIRVLTAEDRLTPIDQIKPGDMVMTFDIGAQADIPKPVLDTFKNENNHYYLINGVVKVTAFERFLTPDGWKKVLNLKPGDKIQTSQGLETIRSLAVQYGPLAVHNLHVEGSHTFYVAGKDERLYLVHNTGGGGGSK